MGYRVEHTTLLTTYTQTFGTWDEAKEYGNAFHGADNAVMTAIFDTETGKRVGCRCGEAYSRQLDPYLPDDLKRELASGNRYTVEYTWLAPKTQAKSFPTMEEAQAWAEPWCGAQDSLGVSVAFFDDKTGKRVGCRAGCLYKCGPPAKAKRKPRGEEEKP